MKRLVFLFCLLFPVFCWGRSFSVEFNDSIREARFCGKWVLTVPDNGHCVYVVNRHGQVREYAPPQGFRCGFLSGVVDGREIIYDHWAGAARYFNPRDGSFSDSIPGSQFAERVVRVGRWVFCGGSYASLKAGSSLVYVYRGVLDKTGIHDLTPIYRLLEFEAGMMQGRFRLQAWHDKLLVCDSVTPVFKVISPETGEIERQVGEILPDEDPRWTLVPQDDAELYKTRINRVDKYARIYFAATDGCTAIFQVRPLRGQFRTRFNCVKTGQPLENPNGLGQQLVVGGKEVTIGIQELTRHKALCLVFDESLLAHQLNFSRR